MSSLRNDLIPMLLRCQYDEEYSKREHLVQFMATQPNLMADAYLLSLTGRPSSLHSSPLFQERLSSVSGSAASSNHGLVSSPSTDKTNLATTTGSSSLHALQAPSSSSSSGGNNADGCFESLVCSAMIVKEKDGFCARANTVGTFLDVNLKMAKQVTSIDPRNMSNVEIGQKSQVFIVFGNQLIWCI